MEIKSIKKATNISGKKVLLRVDFNVPMTNEGKVADEYKIIAALPTLRFLLRYKCKVIVATHLGKPAGVRDEKYSVEPIARYCEKFFPGKISFVGSCRGFEPGTAVGRMKPGEIIFLENLRFEKGEEANSKKFAKDLATLADIYVNDAFAVSHRPHASVSAIKSFLPSYAGSSLAEELENLNKALHPKQPLITIIGGAKISTKLPFIKKMGERSEKILIGGAMANNFLSASGLETGKSFLDKNSLRLVKKCPNKKIILPIDVVVSDRDEIKAKNACSVDKEEKICDIGPKTIRLYSSYIKKAKTIVWNGPLGIFENPHFKHGTTAIARVIAARSRGRAFGLVGGGETISALKLTGMEDWVDWVSTGGGATLAFLSGEKMPGLDKIASKYR